jgi:zinc protease
MLRRRTGHAGPVVSGELSVVEHTLDNGLQVLILPRPQAPVVVSDLHFRVGSVDDPPGRSGLAHLVEHLLFQGTDRFPKGQIDALTFRAGGATNAETGEDDTHYWFALPSNRWELALEIESDRLQNSRFQRAEFERERRVILEERSRELDSAVGRLEELHLAMSYLTHPYRNPILGWLDELRGLTVEAARSHFASHYRLDEALLVLVGDLEPERVLERVSHWLGAVPKREGTRTWSPYVESPQTGRRSFTVENGEGLPRGLIGWHTVPRSHADAPVLDVLADLLVGGTAARLKRRLVDRRRLAAWAQASQEGGRLAGQFLIRVEATPDADPGRVESEIAAELSALAVHGPSEEELSRCRQRLEAAWRWEQQDPVALATGLGGISLWQGWRAWTAEHKAALAVNSDDVRRVAGTYFQEERTTSGWTITRKSTVVLSEFSAADALPDDDAGVPARVIRRRTAQESQFQEVELPRPIKLQPIRFRLANAFRVLADRVPGTGVVAFELYSDAGLLREAKPGVAYATSRIREELVGPGSRRKMVEPLEDVGGQVEFVPSGLSIRCRSEDIEAAVDVIASVLIDPHFTESELRETKRHVIDELRGDIGDSLFRAGREFLKRIYGTHPLGRDARGTVAQFSSITLADIRKHQANWFVPDHSFLVAVGDFEPGALQRVLGAKLQRWKANGKAAPPLPPIRKRPVPCQLRLNRLGEHVHMLYGHLGVARHHPDLAALAVLDHILGSGPGFVDRLSRVLRDELGLAYAVGGGMTDSADLLPGVLRVYLGTNPGSARRARQVVLAELNQLQKGQFGDEEVRAAQCYLARSHVFEYASVSSRAERLLELERWGESVDQAISWPLRVMSLTPDEVRRAAARHLRLNELVEVVSGPSI